MRNTAAATLILIGLAGMSAAAQGRNGRPGGVFQGVPPGQLPPAGQCRVWYQGRPPGRQPAPINCRDAERIASRDRNARVIYGAYPGARTPGPGRSPIGRGASVYQGVPFDNGYRDGYEKGREDARDNDSYDHVRHSRYRSGDHGYDRRFGTKEQYRFVYREGFEAGYDAGYRANLRSDRRSGGFGWPF